MKTSYIIICIALMAIVSYLPRVIPLILVREKLKDGFMKSFLLYMPYGVLAAMVFPGIFYSSPSIISAAAGTAVALIMSFYNKGLLAAAVSSAATVFITERILNMAVN